MSLLNELKQLGPFVKPSARQLYVSIMLKVAKQELIKARSTLTAPARSIGPKEEFRWLIRECDTFQSPANSPLPRLRSS